MGRAKNFYHDITTEAPMAMNEGYTVTHYSLQVIPPIGAEGLDRRPPAGSCRLFLGPGFRLGARWNRLGEAVKTRKDFGKRPKRGELPPSFDTPGAGGRITCSE